MDCFATHLYRLSTSYSVSIVPALVSLTAQPCPCFRRLARLKLVLDA